MSTTDRHSTRRVDAGRTLLVVAWELQPFGGLETRVADLTRTATARGWHVTLLSARPLPEDARWVREVRASGGALRSVHDAWRSSLSGRTASALGRSRARLRGIDLGDPAVEARYGHRSFLRYLSTFWSRAGRDLLRSADVVHLVGAPKSFLADALRAASEFPTPATYQSVHEVTATYVQRKPFVEFIEESHRCAAIFATHERQVEDLRTHFGYRGEVVLVPQWSYEREDELLAIDRSEPRSGPVRIGTLCRFDPVKGLDTLLRGVADAVHEHQLECRIELAGSGPERDRLRGLADELGIGALVHTPGYVEDRVSFYRDLDIFVLSSRAESGPITGAEAMAAALPIVSTAVGAMPERLSQPGSGLLFEPDDHVALAEHLIRLVGDPELRQTMGATARREYTSRFHSELHRERMVERFEALTADP